MAENEISLRDLFRSAKTKQEDIDSLDPRSEEFKTNLQVCVSILKQCSDLVDRLSLFSTNEDLDDVSTSNIQYLGIDYLLAELSTKSYSSADRKAQLDESTLLLERFLNRVDEYSLLTKPDQELLESYKEDPKSFRITGENASMEAKRSTKIRRFQEEKAIKSRLGVLREQTQSLNVDDEITRNLYLAELNLYVHQTFQSLDLITQERQILATMTQQPLPTQQSSQTQTQDNRDRRNGTHNALPYSERLDSPSLLKSGRNTHRGLLDSSGKPMQPFTITSKRTDLRNGVFRPGHSLPTMSIDEYLEEERRRGGIIEGGGPASEQVVQPDEDDVVAQDQATIKAREWDEYVENNPKGAGNTLNRG